MLQLKSMGRQTSGKWFRVPTSGLLEMNDGLVFQEQVNSEDLGPRHSNFWKRVATRDQVTGTTKKSFGDVECTAIV